MSSVKAQLNGLRISPRKVRGIVNLIRRKNVNEALSQLEYYIKRPTPSIKKLLNSAIANAENNFNMVKDNLFIKEIAVDEGTKLKRYKPKGFGLAMSIQKKTSRIRLILDEKVPGLKRDVSAVKKAKDKDEAERKADSKRPEIKEEIGKERKASNFAKRLFRRKAI